jgi:hypothetical protein
MAFEGSYEAQNIGGMYLDNLQISLFLTLFSTNSFKIRQIVRKRYTVNFPLSESEILLRHWTPHSSPVSTPVGRYVSQYHTHTKQ